MQEQEKMRKSPEEAETGAQETEFERFLQESGLNEAQAMGLLRAAYDKQMQLMERAQQVLAAVRAIGDENFTIEALQSSPEAMRTLEEGGTVGEIYRRYFLRRGESGEGGEGEEDANLGMAGLAGGELTPEEIERISRYVSTTGKRYGME